MANTSAVPSDGGVGDVIDQLRRMLDSGRKDEALEVMRDVLESAVRENKQHVARIGELLRKIYGRSAERIDQNQLRLAIDELRASEDALAAGPTPKPDAPLPDEPPTEIAERPKNAKERRAGRRKLPADLPREEIRLVPTTEQIDGKGKMTKVGEDHSEVLEYVPAHFKVLVYIRETWSNAAGEIVTAPAASKVIDKGMPGPGLLTQVVLAKYRDHTPLARQTKIYARSGVELSRNTLVDWVAAVAFLMEPLARRIYELAMRSHLLKVDDTSLAVLDPEHARNVKKGHIWAMVGDHDWVAYKYTEDWTAARAKEFLGQRIGWMQIDGYAGYESIIDSGVVLPVGCWMHARRYFVKAYDAGDLRAAIPIKLIAEMYRIEAESKAAGDDEWQRYERRQRETKPLLDDLEAWIDEHRASEPPKTLLGRALTYNHNHWDILYVVVNDGSIDLDNGDVERALRGPAMGRRNWLFAGSDEGAERAAVIMTVLETAARAGVDLQDYVRDVLVKISEGWLNSRIDELLPKNWAAARAAA
jgi:transposase